MPKKFWIGLVLIMLMYTAYYMLFVETSLANEYVSRKGRHLLKLSFLVIVYIIGLKHLDYSNTKWMKTIWHGIHILGIFILVVFGLYDWLIQMLSLNTKLTLISINELLIAPTLYVAMGILNTALPKMK